MNRRACSPLAARVRRGRSSRAPAPGRRSARARAEGLQCQRAADGGHARRLHLLCVFDALVPPLVEWFNPRGDRRPAWDRYAPCRSLAHLRLTTAGFLRAVRSIRDWGRPLVALGSGGYNPDVVGDAWARAFACLAEVDLPAAPAEEPSGHALVLWRPGGGGAFAGQDNRRRCAGISSSGTEFMRIEEP